MTHDELKSLVPVFALDALGSEEEQELVAHLKVCLECSNILAEHRETAGMLGFAAGSLQAPGDLRDRILSQAAKTSRLQAIAPPVQLKSPSRRSWGGQWAGLAAAACVVALVAVGLTFLRIGGQADRLDRQEQVIAQQREVLNLITSPDSIVLAMTPTEASPGGEGRAFISDREGAAAVVVSGLRDPGDDVYTLWLIVDGEPQPVADFVPHDGLALVPVDGAVEPEMTLAVTVEPNRGNTSPRGPVIMAASRA